MSLQSIAASPSKSFAVFSAMFCFGILIGPLFVFVPSSVFFTFIAICVLCAMFSSLARAAAGLAKGTLPAGRQGLGGVSRQVSKSKVNLHLDAISHPDHGPGSCTGRGSRRGTWFALLALVFLLGVFRYTQSEIPKNVSTVRDAVGHAIRIEGIVAREPAMQGKNQQVVIDHVTIANAPALGRVQVRLSVYKPIQYGDAIAMNCALQVPRPINGFDYARFLEAKGILATCDFPQFVDITSPSPQRWVGSQDPAHAFIRSVLVLKYLLVLQMEKLFPEPHASFLFGVVFGGNVGLDKNVQNDFSRTGTSHILAASGFNVSLFTFVFFGLIIQTPIGKKRGVFVTAFLLFVYVVMAGASAAVVRAAILGSVVLFGSAIGRRASILNALLLAAVLILAFNPRVLLDDVGFQLSFAATAAILYVVPRWEKYFAFVPETLGMREALVGSLSAIVVTLPIMLWQFGSFSLVAPFANVLVLPFIPIVMAATIAALAVSILWLPLGFLAAIPAWAGSWFMLVVITSFSSLTFASVSVPFAHALAVLAAGVIGVALFPLKIEK